MTTLGKKLLVVSHSQTGGTAELTAAALAGAADDAIHGVEIHERDALAASAEDVRWADGLILATPENFGYMSGALKYFFDRIYYPCLEHTQGLGYVLMIKAGNDGLGALNAVNRITTGLAWRQLAEPLVVVGPVTADSIEQARELGMTIAAGLEAGLF